MLDHALIYAKRGWRVFPVGENKKPFYGSHGCDDGTTDPDKIRAMWSAHPGANVAIATGSESNLLVLDVDVKEGKVGRESLDALEKEHGPLPNTVESITWSGGRQIYMTYPHGHEITISASQIGKDLDIRANTGYVVAPPSLVNGRSYQWEAAHHPDDITLAPVPGWLVDLCELCKKKNEEFVLPERIESGTRNEVLFKLACSLRAKGMSKDEILAGLSAGNMRATPPLKHDELAQIADSACGYKPGSDEGAGEIIKESRKSKQNLLKTVQYFHDDPELTGLFRFNSFYGEIQYARAPHWGNEISEGKVFDDDDAIFLKYHLSRKHKHEPTVATIFEAVTQYSRNKIVHPVRDWLNSLTWDGTPRLGSWLSNAAGVKFDEYTSEVGEIVLCAAVARVMSPGIKYDHMVILEGEQGIGKSTLCSVLGGKWYDQMSLIERDKDIIDAMRGRWIIEVDELVCFKREDIERVKSFLTRQVDRTRLAYRRSTQNFPRQSIFIGTMNPEGENKYLRDQTGNRRFWPVECKRIDLGWLREHREQLFAEAVAVWKKGRDLYISSQGALKLAKEAQQDREHEDVWLAPIAKFIENQRKIRSEISVLEVAQECLEIDSGRITKSDQTRIGAVLKKVVGKLPERRWSDGQQVRIYDLKKTTNQNDEIDLENCPIL